MKKILLAVIMFLAVTAYKSGGIKMRRQYGLRVGKG
jgi:hypothetical protein